MVGEGVIDCAKTASVHLMFDLLNWNSCKTRLPIRSAQRNHLMHFASIVNQFAHSNIINRYNFVFSVYWWWFKSVLSWTRVSVKIWSFCKCCWSHWKIYLIVKRRISFWQLLLTMYCWHIWNSAVTILKELIRFKVNGWSLAKSELRRWRSKNNKVDGKWTVCLYSSVEVDGPGV